MAARIQIFRPGKHRASDGRELTFGEADLRQTAQAYDPKKHEAPLVVGHPKRDAPAYGWVKSLHYVEDGVLEVEPDQVDPAFSEMVSAGRFKKTSASFYLPEATGNPVPGGYYLKHVGFLGAAAPAVKGLRSASFTAEEQGVVTVEFGEGEPASPAASTAEQLAAKERDLADREAALRRREAEQAVKERLGQMAAFCEPLVRAGRLLPRDEAGCVAFLAALPEQGVVEFGEGAERQKHSLLAWLKTFLQRLPVQVHYGELAGPEAGKEAGSIEFAAAPGCTLDGGWLELHRRALAYQQQHKCDYATAARAVAGGGAK